MFLPILIAGIALLLLTWIIISSSDKNDEAFRLEPGHYLPPANYFESPQSDESYFWYDPEVHGEYDQPQKKYSKKYTDIQDIFGPDNYFRYYPEDL